MILPLSILLSVGIKFIIYNFFPMSVVPFFFIFGRREHGFEIRKFMIIIH